MKAKVNTSPFDDRAAIVALQRVSFVMIWPLIARGGPQVETPEGNLGVENRRRKLKKKVNCAQGKFNLILKVPDIHNLARGIIRVDEPRLERHVQIRSCCT